MSTLANFAQQERARREILLKSELIPPLPDIVVRVLALLNRTDTEPAQIESHLRYDQVLVGKMLGLVNSPFYGLSRQVTSIKDAVMVLGFRGLRSLILASSTGKFLARDFRCYGFADKGLWQHSICVAAAARALSRKVGESTETAEHLFVAGLLHDIGKMPLAPYLNEKQIRIGNDQSSIEVEARVIGVTHTEAGALIAAKWNLSPMVQDVIARHHGGAGDQHQRETAIIRIANESAKEARTGFMPDYTPFPEPLEPSLTTLGLPAAQWTELAQHIEEAMQTALRSMAGFAN